MTSLYHEKDEVGEQTKLTYMTYIIFTPFLKSPRITL